MSNIKIFRNDINGLRAYAVILVVLFHFGIFGFSAGFIGVDVFFVISGYLMTKIIIDQISESKFSLLKFYLARAIRILPALLFLTIIFAIIGWVVLIPEDYKDYGKHAASSITFLSNIIYWRESSDYFSAGAHNKILLHTWSLSVEWQFYIILPIILGLVARFSKTKKTLKIIVLAGFFISLLLSYKITQVSQTTAFYMIPTRAWEMLAGGLVYAYFDNLRLKNQVRVILEVTGFSLIVISLVIFNIKTPWPGLAALIPVLGSVLILIAANNKSILTKSMPMQWVGNASYSIYLWHWPIVFYLIYFGVQHDYLWIICGITLSILLGWFSYKYIETPSRKYLNKKSIATGYLIILGTTITLFFLFSLIFIKNGFIERADKKYLETVKNIEMPLPTNGWCFYSIDSIRSLSLGKEVLECKVGQLSARAKSKALLFGDSHAGHNIPFWDHVGKDLNIEVQPITTNWCYPGLSDSFPGNKRSPAYSQCKFNRKFLLENMEKYDLIILAGSWGSVASKTEYLKDFEELLRISSSFNKPIVIMASPYRFINNIGLSYKRVIWLGKDFDINKYKNPKDDELAFSGNEKIKLLVSKYKNAIFLDRDILYGKSLADQSGVPYASDQNGHISIFGSKASAKQFETSPIYRDLEAVFK